MSSFKSRLAKVGVAVLGSLPLSVARRVGSGFASACLALNDRNSRVTKRNVALCFPELSELEQRDLARNSMRETGRLAFEIFSVWRSTQNWREKRVLATHGKSKVETALAEGKGLIVLAPHLGNWEIFGAALPAFATATCMYQPPKQTYMDDIIVRCRENTGMVLVPTSSKGVAKQLKALKRGEIVGILPDQCPDMGGEFAPFFGHPAYTMTLLHGLIQRTGCKVVAGFAKRVKGGFEIHYLDPNPSIYDADLATSVAGLNKTVELCVAQCPEQYQWEYKRFRKKVEGFENPYRNMK